MLNKCYTITQLGNACTNEEGKLWIEGCTCCFPIIQGLPNNGGGLKFLPLFFLFSTLPPPSPTLLQPIDDAAFLIPNVFGGTGRAARRCEVEGFIQIHGYIGVLLLLSVWFVVVVLVSLFLEWEWYLLNLPIFLVDRLRNKSCRKKTIILVCTKQIDNQFLPQTLPSVRLGVHG